MQDRRVRKGFPVSRFGRFTLQCDDCGALYSLYGAMNETQAKMKGSKLGWTCNPTEDFCPECSKEEA